MSLGASPILEQIEVGLLQNLVTLIGCPATGEAALVDPAFESERLLARAAALGLRVRLVLVTHTHVDHIDAVAEVVAATGATVHVHALEVEALRAIGVSDPSVLRGGEGLAVGRIPLQALHVPGHTPGAVAYHLHEDGAVVTGDTLFVGSCGRSDFAGGDARALYRSLRTLADLPEETRIYPGHDYGSTPTSTIGREREQNPWLRAAFHDREAEFHSLRR